MYGVWPAMCVVAPGSSAFGFCGRADVLVVVVKSEAMHVADGICVLCGCFSGCAMEFGSAVLCVRGV